MAGMLDYGAALGLGDFVSPLDREIQRSLGREQIEQVKAQTGQSQAYTDHLRQQTQQGYVATREQEEYSRQAQEAIESGDPRRISALIARFPQFKDALKTSWDQTDVLEQRSNLRQAAGIWSALNSGNTQAAVSQLEARIQADRTAGRDTADDEEELALLRSGDPKAINTVKGKLGLFMASVVPDKFASVVEQLGTGAQSGKKGQVVGRAIGSYDENGNFVVDYRDPDPGFTLSEGQVRFETPGSGGNSPTGNVTADAMLPITLSSESGGRDFAPGGGLLTSPEGAQGRMQVMPGTQSDPGFGVAPARDDSVEEKARVGRDYLQAMLTRYGGDPAKAWAAYNAGPGALDAALANGGNWLSAMPAETRAYVAKNMQQLNGGQRQGGATPVASVPKGPAATPPQARQMSPQEVQAAGLDPAQAWYMQANGMPTAVKGGGAQANGAYSQSALDAFDRAIDTATRLKTHPGLSAAVGLKGLSGGFLGGWVVPGTDAADFGAELDAMKAQVFLPMVQSMKGMGALSNAEGEKLTAAIGALSTKQSEKQFGLSLDRIIKDLRTYKQRGMGGAQSSGAPVKVRSIQEARKLAPGTVFIDPNGVRRVR